MGQSWCGKSKKVRDKEKRSELLHHKVKVLTKEEVEKGRSNAYKYLDL